MKASYLGALLAIAVFGTCVSTPPPRSSIVADAPTTASPIAVTSSAPAVETPAPPPRPPEAAFCRRPITPGLTLAQVSDATLRSLILGGAPGQRHALDCLGHSVAYEHPVPPRVQRFDSGGARMAAFVVLAEEPGYTESSPGFAAIVRLDADEIVVEGVGPERIDDNAETTALKLTLLDGRRALLFPHVVSTGEDGDFEAAWEVWLPDERGTLRSAGRATSTRAMGNGSMSTGAWFGAMDAHLLDAGTMQVEEHWDDVRYDADGGEHHRNKRTVIRSYSLDAGKLVTQ